MNLPPSYEQLEFEEDHQPSKFERLLRPLRQVVDPVARAWAAVGARTEALVSKVMHPLLAKRLVFLICVVAVFIFLYLRDAVPEKSFLTDKSIKSLLLEQIELGHIKHTSEYFNSFPHVSGTTGTKATAKYVYDALLGYGIDRAEISPQQVFLTHMESSTISYTFEGSEASFQVEEGTAMADQPNPHMPLGVGGSATGPLVYANFGTRDDLNYLAKMSVSLEGAIIAVRYGGGSPGMTAHRLWDYGAAGVIFFSYKTPGTLNWPEGPDYSPDSVQRASLGVPQLWPGDISSPGWSSANQMAVSIDNAQNIVKIPVVSLSWTQVGPLLRTLEGHGMAVPDWHNNGWPDVEWWTGDQQTQVTLDVRVVAENRHTIYNVLGRVSGIEQQRDAVLVGASLDSMCGGGVKLSGLAVLLEVARVFSYLAYQQGWKPLRTIYFTVWDGSTQNFAGVTEWIEGVSSRISGDGLVYIDLDKGVSGDQLWAEGSPEIYLENLERSMPWDFGSSDAFSSHCGVPAISLGMVGEVYPKDSCFDSSEWQQKFGDSSFESHERLAKIVAELVLELSDSPIIPFNLSYFSHQTERYVGDLEDFVAAQLGPSNSERFAEQFTSIRAALEDIDRAGQRTDAWAVQWHHSVEGLVAEPPGLAAQRLDWNDRLTAFGKKFLHRGGLYTNRDWFKNVVFGPKYEALATDTNSGTFPGVRDLVWLNAVNSVGDALQLVADCLKDAAQTVLDARW